MAFREVRVFEVREVLRLWVAGEGIRSVERHARVDRKTVRRYVDAAKAVGVVADGDDGQLSDELIGMVVESVRPHRSDGHGQGWRLLLAHHDDVAGWVADEVTGVKIAELLARRGVVVPVRTVQRYVHEVCGRHRGRGPTVRVADGEPGDELQVDFGRLGFLIDPDSGRRRVVHGLVFTACYSRHCFVWLTHRQTTADVIDGFEAAWRFFGGVFTTVIPDNLSAVVDDADPLQPRLNQAFVEYAQARGFRVDPARVRRPQDKPRVERTVSFVQRSFFARETFIDLADAQRRAEAWCRERAGMRVHGTTQRRPARGVHHRRAVAAGGGTHRGLRPADLRPPEGASGPPHRSRQGALFGAGQPDRHDGRGSRRSQPGADLRPWPAGQGAPPPATRAPFHRPR